MPQSFRVIAPTCFVLAFATVVLSDSPTPARETRGQPGRPTTVHGDLRLHPDFPSAVLGNRRTIRVLLPPGYDDPAAAEKHYPVIYAHDGQNLFDRATSAFGHEWQLDETLAELVGRGEIPPAIIVGIDNTPDRISEYTADATERGGGRVGDYARFLISELKPFIDTTYRTQPDRHTTFTLGASLGGLVTLYLLREHPDVFGGGAAVSPSLWWANEAETKRWQLSPEPLSPASPPSPDHETTTRGGALPATSLPPGHHVRLWLDIGTREGPEGQWAGHVERVRRLRQVVSTRNDVTLGYLEAEGGIHSEAAWATRTADILRFLLNSGEGREQPPAPAP